VLSTLQNQAELHAGHCALCARSMVPNESVNNVEQKCYWETTKSEETRAPDLAAWDKIEARTKLAHTKRRCRRRKIRTVEHSRGTEGKSLAENQVGT
jgi:hypothetical protein